MKVITSILMRKKTPEKNISEEKEENLKVSQKPSYGISEREYPSFLDAETLLSINPSVEFLRKAIKEQAGLSDENFDKFYRPVLCNFAELVQGIGASQRYHHAQLFGLLEHSMEVAWYAMQWAEGDQYMPSGSPEDIADLKRVYRYSVFVAALLHDVGKALTNVRWEVRPNRDTPWQFWNPLITARPTEADNIQYRTKGFCNAEGINVYNQKSHEIAGLTVLTSLVPNSGLSFIVEFAERFSPELYIHFIHALGGDYDNANLLGECVREADAQSTKEGTIRYHERSSSDTFVNLDDPNLPLSESYREVFRRMFANPGEFGLVTNKVAMGKYSVIERFGDLLFVSAKAVLPKVNKELKESNKRISNDQAMYSMLADNNVTIKAPSGDTLWWAEFYSPNNANQAREHSYMVFNINDFEDVAIEDLRCFDVQCFVSQKSLRENEEEITEELHPELYDLMYGSEFELKVKSKLRQAAEEQEAKESSQSEEVKSSEDEDDNSAPEVVVIGSTEVSDDLSRRTTPKEEVTPSVQQTVISAPPTRIDIPEEQPVKDVEGRNNTTDSTPSVSKPKSQTKKSSGGKSGSGKQSNGNKPTDLLSKMASVGLGGVKVTSAPLKPPAPKPAEEKQPVVASPDLAPTTTPMSNESNKSQVVTTQVPPLEMVKEDASAEVEDNPFDTVIKINNMPLESEVDDVLLDKFLEREPLAHALEGMTVNEGEDAVKASASLIFTWLPYLETLIANQLISGAGEDSIVHAIKNGLFIVKDQIETNFTPDVAKELIRVLELSTFTLRKDGNPLVLCIDENAVPINGYVLGGYRNFKIMNNQIKMNMKIKLV